MTIGILETGAPPKSLQPRFGSYVEMVETLIGPDQDYRAFDVAAGDSPSVGQPCAAYVITGSPAGVYEDLPWIAPLSDFLRKVKGRAKLVGICFGHQLMAQAFGGRVEKSPKGWGVGLQTYEIAEREPRMDSMAPIAVAVSHQDQVIELPPAAKVLGGNAFAPFGLLAYEDQPAISMQCHPEFSPDYAKALLRTRWAAAALEPEQAKAAIASLDAPNDSRRVAGWIRRFLG